MERLNKIRVHEKKKVNTCCSVVRANQSLGKYFCERLKAILKSENAAKLPISQVFLIWKLLKRLDDELVELMVHPKERKDVFGIEISAPNLEIAPRLRALSSIVHIDNTEADFIVMHHGRAHLFERSETFLSHFVHSLEFDEDDNVKGLFGRHLMFYLVKGNEQTMLRLLLDRNVNMDESEQALINPSKTPFWLACENGNEEIVAMFMYYNVAANLSIPENNKKYRSLLQPIARAMFRGHGNLVKMLMDYTYDAWSDFNVNDFLHFAFARSPYFFTLAKLQREYPDTLSFCYKEIILRQIWLELFTMPSTFFEEVLHFFALKQGPRDYLLACFCVDDWKRCWFHPDMRRLAPRRNFFENLQLLGSSPSQSEPSLLHMMMDKLHDSWPLHVVLETCCYNLPPAEIEPVVLLLLSNNASMGCYTLELVLQNAFWFDNHKLFKICCLLDVDCSQKTPRYYSENGGNNVGYLVSRLYHRFPIEKTIMEVVDDPSNISKSNIGYFARMSSYPKIKVKARSRDLNMPEPAVRILTAMADRSPEFPKLLEFARDVARKYVVSKYEVKTSCQFYGAVKQLEVPERLKRIIEYDLYTPLYS